MRATTPFLSALIALLFTIAPHTATEHGHKNQHQQTAPPVTLDRATPFYDTFTTNPAFATDEASFAAIENLYLGLTNLDAGTGDIVPELAQTWDISADGLTYTFHLRDDVWWVYLKDGQIEQWRTVTADDLVASIERGCLPNRDAEGNNNYYGTLIANVIAGCEVLNQLPDDAPIPSDVLQVSAPDTHTLVIGLQTPAAYFLSMTTLPILHPTPADIADLPAGVIPTNGPYLAQELSEVRRVFIRNPHLPADLWGGGNIDVVNIQNIEDVGTIYGLYLDHQVDQATVPTSETEPVYSPDLLAEFVQLTDGAVFYFGYANDKPPFDDVRVRRAFSAIVDRQAFIDWIQGGRGVSMTHFTPPEMPYAPPREGIGVGFDPEFAREQLALAGYPDCAGFPPMDMAAYQGAGTWIEFWAAAAEEHLGCDPDLFDIEQIEFSALVAITRPDAPVDNRPNAWTLGWGADYADPNTWVYDVLYCTTTQTHFGRSCSATDDLISEAATNPDPAERTRLYEEIEEAFFGPDGEQPIVPIFQRAIFVLVQKWYTGPFQTDGVTGLVHWDAYSIDMEAKLAARGS